MFRKPQTESREPAVGSTQRTSICTRKTFTKSLTSAILTTKTNTPARTQNENGNTRPPKTRSASLSENITKTLKTKPVTVGRRATKRSTMKESLAINPELVKTRLRRSSTSSSSHKKEQRKSTGTRRSSTAEKASEEEPKETIRITRSSCRRSSIDKIEPKVVKQVRVNAKNLTEKDLQQIVADISNNNGDDSQIPIQNSSMETLKVNDDYSALERAYKTLANPNIDRNSQVRTKIHNYNDSVDASFYLHLSADDGDDDDEKNEGIPNISTQVQEKVDEDYRDAVKAAAREKHFINSNERGVTKSSSFSCLETDERRSPLSSAEHIVKISQYVKETCKSPSFIPLRDLKGHDRNSDTRSVQKQNMFYWVNLGKETVRRSTSPPRTQDDDKAEHLRECARRRVISHLQQHRQLFQSVTDKKLEFAVAKEDQNKTSVRIADHSDISEPFEKKSESSVPEEEKALFSNYSDFMREKEEIHSESKSSSSTNEELDESVKSSASDDYSFEISSDFEEREATHFPEYDQSTVLASFMVASQHVPNGSVSVKKKEEPLPSKGQNSYETQDSYISDSTASITAQLKTDKGNEFLEQEELDDDVMDKSYKEVECCFVEVEDETVVSLTKREEALPSKEQDSFGNETPTMSTRRELETDSEESVQDSDDKIYSISSTDSESILVVKPTDDDSDPEIIKKDSDVIIIIIEDETINSVDTEDGDTSNQECSRNDVFVCEDVNLLSAEGNENEKKDVKTVEKNTFGITIKAFFEETEPSRQSPGIHPVILSASTSCNKPEPLASITLPLHINDNVIEITDIKKSVAYLVRHLYNAIGRKCKSRIRLNISVENLQDKNVSLNQSGRLKQLGSEESVSDLEDRLKRGLSDLWSITDLRNISKCFVQPSTKVNNTFWFTDEVGVDIKPDWTFGTNRLLRRTT